jgi:hypothetical protein
MIQNDVRGRALDRLAAAFNRPPSVAVHDAYKEALAGLSDDEFTFAAEKALTSCDRWPVPKVLLGFALEERSRVRHRFRPAGDDGHLPMCPECGAVPGWHKYRTPKAPSVVERMVVRHGTGRQCERLNDGREWV